MDEAERKRINDLLGQYREIRRRMQATFRRAEESRALTEEVLERHKKHPPRPYSERN